MDWTFFTPSYLEQIESSTPTLYDINNDGNLEVIFTSSPDQYSIPGPITAKVFVLDSGGNILWTREIPNALIEESPSIGDLDADGSPEIVFPATVENSEENLLYIYVLDSEGNDFIEPILVASDPNYVIKGTSPALADIDNDGCLEIVLGKSVDGSSIGVWNHDGSLAWQSQIVSSFPMEPPAVGDIDNNGDLEIVISYVGSQQNQIYAFNHYGTLVDGWPVGGFGSTLKGLPILSDINNDGYLEIIVPKTSKLAVLDYLGNEIFTDNFYYPSGDLVTKAAAVDDLEYNGRTDLILPRREGNVFAWELDTALGTENKGWPSLHYDERNTGCYECFVERSCPSPNTCPLDINNDYFVDAFDLAILLGAWGTPGCNGNLPCDSDFNGDENVNTFDLAILLGAWGPCQGDTAVQAPVQIPEEELQSIKDTLSASDYSSFTRQYPQYKV